MKIIYLAKHRPGDIDEGAGISFALESMGHEVVKVPEAEGGMSPLPEGDMLLSHHFYPFDSIQRSMTRPKCCWYFDLVSFNDPMIVDRCNARIRWHAEALNVFDLMFMNDGDWVQRDTTGKLRVLKEGADERYIGRGTKEGWDERWFGRGKVDGGIAFVGNQRGGTTRLSWVADMQQRYGNRFFVIGGSRQPRVWQRELADLLTSVDVVACPDGPVTDLYWSNRVYLMTAFGKFTVHPYCKALTYEFVDGVEIMFYKSRAEMFEIIDWAVAHPAERETIAAAGMRATAERHTYRKRLERMLRFVQEWKAMREAP